MNKFQKFVNKKAKAWYTMKENQESEHPFTFRECRMEWRRAFNYNIFYQIMLDEIGITKREHNK